MLIFPADVGTVHTLKTIFRQYFYGTILDDIQEKGCWNKICQDYFTTEFDRMPSKEVKKLSTSSIKNI